MSVDLDQHLVHLLARSDWVARRNDLISAGVSSSSIDRRLRSGLLTSFGGGVVGLADGPDRRRQQLRAVTLKRPTGVLSHLTAAEVHGVAFDRRPRRIHLTIPHGTSRAGRDVIAHQSVYLPAADRTEIAGLAVTTPARTLCDLAGGPELRADRLDALVAWMIERGLTSAEEIRQCADRLRRRGRGGAKERRALVASLAVRTEVDPLDLELQFLRLVTTWGLAGLDPAERPDWYEPAPGVVTFTAVAARRIVELDARPKRIAPQERRHDRTREAEASARGWRLERYGWAEVVHRPKQLRADLEWLLDTGQAAA